MFDIGGVFLYPNWQGPAAKLAELNLPPRSNRTDFRRAHHAGAAALAAADRPTEEHKQDFWRLYDDAYARDLEVPESDRGEFRPAIRGVWDWRHDENVDAFHELQASGMPLAIVSNNDGTAAEQMRDHRICWVNDAHDLPRVRSIVDSSLIGVAKPDPMIMAPALHSIGLPPEQVLYVGDTAHADIAGATNAGMQSVQLDPFDHFAAYNHDRVVDLAELNRVLSAA